MIRGPSPFAASSPSAWRARFACARWSRRSTTAPVKNARVAGYQTFGKTGTAEVAYPDGGGYIPNEHAGSFVGGAPADDPRVAVLVTLYRPSGGRYFGGTVAAPAVAAIISDTLEYMRVPHDPLPAARGHDAVATAAR